MEYLITTTNGELYHHGVKGQKWGVRNYQNKDGSYKPGAEGRYDGDSSTNRVKTTKAAKKEAKRSGLSDKAKRNLKIAAGVAGTALAAYGTYKAAKFIQGKRESKAMAKAEDYVANYSMKKIGETRWQNGKIAETFANNHGRSVDVTSMNGGERYGIDHVNRINRAVNKKAMQYYDEMTNTKFDKALGKITKAGDSVKNVANKTGNGIKKVTSKPANAVKTGTKKATNSLLDLVNPKYEYREGPASVKVTDLGNGIRKTVTTTPTFKVKVKRK